MAAVAVLLALPSCMDQTGPPVRFVVPDGFRGRIEILEAKDAEEVGLDRGEYLYRVPEGGILRVRKVVGFGSWHKTYAFFSSGREIPVRFTSDPERVPGEIAFYELGGSSFFVGTRNEMLQYVKNPPPDNEAAAFWSGRWRTNPPDSPARQGKGTRP